MHGYTTGLFYIAILDVKENTDCILADCELATNCAGITFSIMQEIVILAVVLVS